MEAWLQPLDQSRFTPGWREVVGAARLAHGARFQAGEGAWGGLRRERASCYFASDPPCPTPIQVCFLA